MIIYSEKYSKKVGNGHEQGGVYENALSISEVVTSSDPSAPVKSGGCLPHNSSDSSQVTSTKSTAGVAKHSNTIRSVINKFKLPQIFMDRLENIDKPFVRDLTKCRRYVMVISYSQVSRFYICVFFVFFL